MDYINKNIAINLKKIRIAKNLSLEETAEQTGVSKSMLAQIERGEANPSIGCLGKIVSGLRVELTELIETPMQETYYISKDEIVPTKEVEGQYSIFTYFPYEKDKPFEIYGMDIYRNGTYYSGSHGENTVEYITVATGTLTLKVRDKKYVIHPGDAFRFDSDIEHWYCNEGTDMVRLTSIFSFK
ncbi:helix-turn-helix domain-containing protein [Anaerocolumna sedimenticola]|uniref:Helix-turn-helix domain-containing protein n=1 Tax=Anaerocolumna sedimenticola TaxID=2696063 RepID=A0A6P1THR6_9FIRM|nr:XRE family transcriptional regulator [Anaerocolumna sedimenticola]QHQ59837.1 helix-turn-helix domain-containing protein [Anaerocolumna sedimenticola]